MIHAWYTPWDSNANFDLLLQSDGKGKSLLFLQPSEVGFLKHLKEARVPLVEFEFPAKRIFNIQSQLEKLIKQNYYLNKVKSTFRFSYTVILHEDWLLDM